jgi:hypothetical protein
MRVQRGEDVGDPLALSSGGDIACLVIGNIKWVGEDGEVARLE